MHGQEHFEAAEALSGGRQNPEFQRIVAHAKRRAGDDGYGKAIRDLKLDAIVAITRGPAPLIQPDGSAGAGAALDRPKGSQRPSISGQAALAGYPNLTVPMGQVNGLPVGLSWVGLPWSEQKLLGYGYAYEQASHKRAPPIAYKQAVAARQ